MPDKYRVQLTRRAANELQVIYDYIEHDSPQNAARMVTRMMRAIDGLGILPHRYKRVDFSELPGEQIRSMPVRPFLVRYCVDDAARLVSILSVRHGARRPGL